MVEGSDREREVPVAPLSERQARAKWPWIVAIGFLALWSPQWSPSPSSPGATTAIG